MATLKDSLHSAVYTRDGEVSFLLSNDWASNLSPVAFTGLSASPFTLVP